MHAENLENVKKKKKKHKGLQRQINQQKQKEFTSRYKPLPFRHYASRLCLCPYSHMCISFLECNLFLLTYYSTVWTCISWNVLGSNFSLSFFSSVGSPHCPVAGSLSPRRLIAIDRPRPPRASLFTQREPGLSWKGWQGSANLYITLHIFSF